MDSQVWSPRACNGNTARSRLARGLSSREPGTGVAVDLRGPNHSSVLWDQDIVPVEPPTLHPCATTPCPLPCPLPAPPDGSPVYRSTGRQLLLPPPHRPLCPSQGALSWPWSIPDLS